MTDQLTKLGYYTQEAEMKPHDSLQERKAKEFIEDYESVASNAVGLLCILFGAVSGGIVTCAILWLTHHIC